MTFTPEPGGVPVPGASVAENVPLADVDVSAEMVSVPPPPVASLLQPNPVVVSDSDTHA
jgi:hypothetical protein